MPLLYVFNHNNHKCKKVDLNSVLDVYFHVQKYGLLLCSIALMATAFVQKNRNQFPLMSLPHLSLTCEEPIYVLSIREEPQSLWRRVSQNYTINRFVASVGPDELVSAKPWVAYGYGTTVTEALNDAITHYRYGRMVA
jgi:hypothetical protein